jgi:hypothetical protein
MNWNGYVRKRLWPNLKYYPYIFLEGVRKTTKNPKQDSQSLGRDLNPGPPEYEEGGKTTRPRRSVVCLFHLRNSHDCHVGITDSALKLLYTFHVCPIELHVQSIIMYMV